MSGRDPKHGSGGRLAALALLPFVLAAFLVYERALDGPFVSDDLPVLANNPYVTSPGPDWWGEIFDPQGEPRQHAGGNYSPAMHAAHALQWKLWQGATRHYHAFNVALHALNAALLVWALFAAGLSRRASLLGGAIFLLHPANVEAVAWITQLRSELAWAAGIGALLLFSRLPLASPLLFGAGLLAKASASFVLPLLAMTAWLRRRDAERPREQVVALGLCVAALLVFAPIQLQVFVDVAADVRDPYPDLATQIRSIGAIGARYLAMALSGTGTAYYHAPEPVRSALDPWWLAGLAAVPLFAWRIGVTLRRGSIEAAWWLSAAAGFAPVSQFVPFTAPLADRYLYFILPGLIGGGALAFRELREKIALHPRTRGIAPHFARAALALLVVGVFAFGIQARQRATLWSSIRLLYADSAARYPDSATAHYFAAVQALERRDPDAALRSLRASMERDGHLTDDFRSPVLAALRSNPEYRALMREVAADEIELAQRRGVPDPLHLARLHFERGELDEAIAALEQGIRREGPDPALVQAVMRLRAQRDARDAPTPTPRPEGLRELPPLLP